MSDEKGIRFLMVSKEKSMKISDVVDGYYILVD